MLVKKKISADISYEFVDDNVSFQYTFETIK